MSIQSERDDLFEECKMAAKRIKELEADVENLLTFDHTFAPTGGLTKHKHAVQEAARLLRYCKSKGVIK